MKFIWITEDEIGMLIGLAVGTPILIFILWITGYL